MAWAELGSVDMSENWQFFPGLPTPIFRVRHYKSAPGYATGELGISGGGGIDAFSQLTPIYPRDEPIQYQFGVPYAWSLCYPSVRAKIINPGSLIWTLAIDVWI